MCEGSHDEASDGLPGTEIIAVVAAKRMNREEFFRALSGFDEERLQKAPWNLYWRGTANVRERIEAEQIGRAHV